MHVRPRHWQSYRKAYNIANHFSYGGTIIWAHGITFGQPNDATYGITDKFAYVLSDGRSNKCPHLWPYQRSNNRPDKWSVGCPN